MSATKFTLLFFLMTPAFLQGQSDTLNELFKNAYEVFELLRNEQGIYRDSKVFAGSDYHPSSVASIGMGLISLCIADQMGWIDDAEEKALITLKNIISTKPPFAPDRNISGFYRHWIEMETGAQAWNSAYSTIDSGILTCGALFCKKYFCTNESIARCVDELWRSIDWSKAIQNPETGGIYLTMEPDGEGTPGAITLPFNEYMIVAWLAYHQESTIMPGPATELWHKFYATPSALPTKDFMGIPVLTDQANQFLSSFVIQFTYYLCHHFTTNQEYLSFFEHARQADSLWWRLQPLAQPFEWGLGAGSAANDTGYHPDGLDNNSLLIYSPHIIAGFLPTYPAGANDLIKLFKDGHSIYPLPNNNASQVLWRKSLVAPDWNANEIQGVDYSTMLFGLATLPSFLGPPFFATYNRFFEGPCQTPTISNTQVHSHFSKLEVYPNPTSSEIYLAFAHNYIGQLDIRLFNKLGILQASYSGVKQALNFQETIDINHLENGYYFLEIRGSEMYGIEKIVVAK